MNKDKENIREIDLEMIARVCHNANRAIRLATEGLDDATPLWDDASEEQKKSTLRGVVFALNNPFASAIEQHNVWLKDKIENGWTWGPVKDSNLKTHPCITYYDDLPQKEIIKDYVFKSIVNSLLVVTPKKEQSIKNLAIFNTDTGHLQQSDEYIIVDKVNTIREHPSENGVRVDTFGYSPKEAEEKVRDTAHEYLAEHVAKTLKGNKISDIHRIIDKLWAILDNYQRETVYKG